MLQSRHGVHAGLLAGAMLGLLALAPAHAYSDQADDDARQNIVETAAGADDLSTLVAAVEAGDLVDTLSGEGPFTVFAPTNAAFGELPDGTVDALLESANREQLRGILTYHVVAGEATASAVVDMIESGDGSARVDTVQGQTLSLMLDGGDVIVEDARGNRATVTAADVMASNGVVHLIDGVLLPSE